MRSSSSKNSNSNAWKNGGAAADASTATETDPLLAVQNSTTVNVNVSAGGAGTGASASAAAALTPSYSRTANASNIRVRRTSNSKSPVGNQHFGVSSEMNNQASTATGSTGYPDEEIQQAYNILRDENSRLGNPSSSADAQSVASSSGQSAGSRSVHQFRRHYVARGSGEHPPLLEIPEEIYNVRKSALTVLKPLTRTWLVVSVGFALSILFGMARWTGMLIGLPFWFILLPSWLSHVGLFWCHLLSAKALSTFIAAANDNRQRPDSRDHLDRTEYLPLLQRSLKFGLKTGLVSFGFFIFEILLYFRLSKGTMSLATVFTPFWVMVVGGTIDGIICKTQHFLRVVCWLLAFTSMLFACLKVDYSTEWVPWRLVVAPIIAVLSIASGTLIYIVYGHQLGYYRLTEAQLKAGNLYALAALICIVLVVVVGEVMPLARPVEIETRLFVVLMAPIVLTLVGMGAWVVSRDEFGRLLLYGGQAAVHPKKLRWEKNGWACIQGRGVTSIPMFGEITFCPLEKKPLENKIELCSCCTCYPYEEEEEEEEVMDYPDELGAHPYLAPLGASGDQSIKHSPV